MIDDDTKQRVKRLAEARNRTAHWLMREAITQYVEREEKREAFRQDVLKAWDDYRTTGMHVPADEADAWLGQLEEATISNRLNVASDLVTASTVRRAAPVSMGIWS